MRTPCCRLLLAAAVPGRLRHREHRRRRRCGDADDARALTVESSEDACDLSAAEAPAGTLTFDVTNSGSQVTEFYLLGDDGLRIVAEVENIGPNLNRELTVNAPGGLLRHRLQAGHEGRGHPRRLHRDRVRRGPVHRRRRPALVDQATANYAAYVEDQSAQLLEKTTEFVELYKSGDDDAARALYPAPARTGSGSRPWPSRSATSTR